MTVRAWGSGRPFRRQHGSLGESRRPLPVAAAAVLVAAAGAWGQDSVAVNTGVIGDSLDAYRTTAPSEQVVHYVLDLAPLESSWGGRYALGPLAKSSKANSLGVASHLIGAQATSGFVTGPFASDVYMAWAAPGAGVNATRNTAGVVVDASSFTGDTFGAAFMEFGDGPDGAFGTADDENNIIAVLIGMLRSNPNRLYVTRTVAATNKPFNGAGPSGTASFGLGGVDAAGNVALLADGYMMESPLAVGGKRIYRVDAAARSEGVVNHLAQGGAGDAAATQMLLQSGTMLLTPTLIGEAAAARNGGAVIGTDFKNQHLFEQVAGSLSAASAPAPAGVAGLRGPVRFVSQTSPLVNGGGADAGLVLALARTNGGSATRGMVVYGVNTDGSPDSRVLATLPAAGSLTDHDDGFDAGTALPPLSAHEFTGYEGQVSFRGGNGPAAATVLPDGDLLLAATVRGPDQPGDLPGSNNHIAVARIDAQGGATRWFIAAHTGAAGLNNGKAIRGDYGADGVPNTGDAGEGDGALDAAPIGRIVRAGEVEGVLAGPSLSAPAMDRAGNVYFAATVALNTPEGEVNTTALLRANFNEAAESYQLELLLREGQRITGPNSLTEYRIGRLSVADADSIDSGTVFSSSLVQNEIAGVNLGSTPAHSPFTLGAMIVRTKIVYDRNGDGSFEDPELAGGAGVDQPYRAVMVIMPRVAPGDYDRNGSTDVFDLLAFLDDWFGNAADYDANGSTDVFDLLAYLDDWFA